MTTAEKLPPPPPRRPAHYHCGLVRADERIPADDAAARAWLHHREEALVDLVWQVIAGLAPRRPVAIFDAGCGEGGALARFVELAAPAPLELTGITLSQKQGELATHYLPQATWLVGDMLAEPSLVARQFDVVVAIQSTEYVGASRLAEFMRRAAGWLTPPGLLVVVAGSWARPLPPEAPLAQLVSRFYRAEISLTDHYRQAASQAGLRSLAELDLGPATLNYWQVRRDRPALRSSPGGLVEHVFYLALANGQADYRLYAWSRER